MDKINLQILKFYEEGVFNEPNGSEKNSKVKEVESILFNGGIMKFLDKLNSRLSEKIFNEYGLLHPVAPVIYDESGLFLLGESEDLRLISFEEDYSKADIVEAIQQNIEAIEYNAFQILKNEIDLLNHNKKAFEIMLMTIVDEKKTAGLFDFNPTYYNPIQDNRIIAHLSSDGPILKARVWGVEAVVKRKMSQYYLIYLEKKKYTHSEAYEILGPVVDEIIEDHKELAFKQVCQSVKETLVNVHNLTSAQLELIQFIKDNKEFITVDKRNVIVPLNVSPLGVAKAAEYARVLDYFNQQPNYIQNVTRFFQIGTTNDFHLPSGILPATVSLDDAKDLVKLIPIEVAKGLHFIESGSTALRPQKLPSLGKGFFIKWVATFSYKESKFERYDYRLPNSKKIKSIMFENGTAISANRYFRILRKYRKLG